MRHAVYDYDHYVVYVAGQPDLHHRLLVRTSEQVIVGSGSPSAQTGKAAELACRQRMLVDPPVIACLYARLLALYITGDYGWLGYTSVGFSGVSSSTLSVLMHISETQTAVRMPAWSYIQVIGQPRFRPS